MPLLTFIPAQTTEPSALARTLTSLWDTAAEYLQAEGAAFALNLATAVVIFFIGKWLAGVLSRLAGRVLSRAKVDDMLVRLPSTSSTPYC